MQQIAWTLEILGKMGVKSCWTKWQWRLKESRKNSSLPLVFSARCLRDFTDASWLSAIARPFSSSLARSESKSNSEKIDQLAFKLIRIKMDGKVFWWAICVCTFPIVIYSRRSYDWLFLNKNSVSCHRREFLNCCPKWSHRNFHLSLRSNRYQWLQRIVLCS